MKSPLLIHGTWTFTGYDKEGRIKWQIEQPNLVTDEARNHVLETVVCNNTQVPTWYIGLKHAGTPNNNDTLASHISWAECSNYTGNRKAYVPSAASAGLVTNNDSKASFQFTENNQTIAGGFLCSAASGTSGILFSVADFTTGNKSFDSGDTLNVTYNISVTSA